jgi:surface protein
MSPIADTTSPEQYLTEGWTAIPVVPFLSIDGYTQETEPFMFPHRKQRAPMDSRKTRAEERDDLKSAATLSAASEIHANPPSPPPGQDSLLNTKFMLAMTRALDNSNDDIENDKEQSMEQKETPDDERAATRSTVRNTSDASSFRPGIVYHRHTKLVSGSRSDSETEMHTDTTESSDIPTSHGRSSAIDEENIATARLVNEAQIRETTLPVAAQLVVKATQVQLDHSRCRARYGGFAVCVVLILLIAIVATTTLSRSSKYVPQGESQPTSTPIVYSVFNRTEQLYDAVDAYLMGMQEDESNIGTNTPLDQSNVSLTYGYPIGIWDVSRLTNFSRVFDPGRSPTSVRAGTFNQDLSDWDVSNAVTMERMFAGAENFRGFGLDRWNVSRVQDFSYMLAGAKIIDADVSAWNTANAKTMEGMFSKTQKFNGRLATWNVSNVESMAFMFSSARGYKGGDLRQWNVSKVLDMTEQFSFSLFNGDISNWDTSQVKTMNGMVRFIVLTRDLTV